MEKLNHFMKFKTGFSPTYKVWPNTTSPNHNTRINKVRYDQFGSQFTTIAVVKKITSMYPYNLTYDTEVDN